MQDPIRYCIYVFIQTFAALSSIRLVRLTVNCIRS